MTHVYFTSPGEWNPEDEEDDDDDWNFDGDPDPDELDDDAFWESRDGWIQDEETLAQAVGDADEINAIRIIKRVQIRRLETMINGLGSKKKDIDYEALRPHFAWKPAEVIY